MTTIGAVEAKTKFSELLARAEKGESFTITRHGREVAELRPLAPHDREKARAAMIRIRERASRQRLGPDLTIRELRDEGRKR